MILVRWTISILAVIAAVFVASFSLSLHPPIYTPLVASVAGVVFAIVVNPLGARLLSLRGGSAVALATIAFVVGTAVLGWSGYNRLMWGAEQERIADDTVRETNTINGYSAMLDIAFSDDDIAAPNSAAMAGYRSELPLVKKLANHYWLTKNGGNACLLQVIELLKYDAATELFSNGDDRALFLLNVQMLVRDDHDRLRYFALPPEKQLRRAAALWLAAQLQGSEVPQSMDIDDAIKAARTEFAAFTDDVRKNPDSWYREPEIQLRCIDPVIPIKGGYEKQGLETSPNGLPADEVQKILHNALVAQNDPGAVLAWGALCLQGNADGCEGYTAMFDEFDEGGPRDWTAAQPYYKLACDRGSGSSCYMMAVILSGNSETVAQAYEFSQRACDEGDTRGCNAHWTAPPSTSAPAAAPNSASVHPEQLYGSVTENVSDYSVDIRCGGIGLAGMEAAKLKGDTARYKRLHNEFERLYQLAVSTGAKSDTVRDDMKEAGAEALHIVEQPESSPLWLNYLDWIEVCKADGFNL